MKTRQLSHIQIVQMFRKQTEAFVGTIFFGIGFLFLFLAFNSSIGLGNIIRFQIGEKGTTTGTNIQSYRTSSEENNTPIVRYECSYQVAGKNYIASSYTTGYKYSFSAGVQVDYLISDPSIGKLKGMRLTAFSWWVGLIMAVFPMVGGIMMFLGFKELSKRIQIIQNGQLGYGKLIHKRGTGSTSNGRRIYKMTFEYSVNGQNFTCTNKTRKPEDLEDELEERLIYDRKHPENAVMLDLLPNSVKRLFVKDEIF